MYGAFGKKAQFGKRVPHGKQGYQHETAPLSANRERGADTAAKAR